MTIYNSDSNKIYNTYMPINGYRSDDETDEIGKYDLKDSLDLHYFVRQAIFWPDETRTRHPKEAYKVGYAQLIMTQFVNAYCETYVPGHYLSDDNYNHIWEALFKTIFSNTLSDKQTYTSVKTKSNTLFL